MLEGEEEGNHEAEGCWEVAGRPEMWAGEGIEGKEIQSNGDDFKL